MTRNLFGSIDVSATALLVWGVLTLFGFLDNGDWMWPEQEIWKMVAILVLFGLVGKVLVELKKPGRMKNEDL